MKIIGFTLELDGEREAVERVFDAVGEALKELREESIHEEWVGDPLSPRPVLGLMPVRGKITIREEEQ